MKDGEIKVLKVVDITKIGAFLDWGKPKDLFLPYGEMTVDLRPDMEILVRKYTDKSGRDAASMKGLYHLLSTQSPYQAGDEVIGRIYEFGHDFGTFVAVDDKYSAMIPRHESVGIADVGDVIKARVAFVKEDGKLDLSLRRTGSAQRGEDREVILELLEDYAGVLPFTEKAEPAVILRECGMSKRAFKNALGALYKERLITIGKDGTIRLN